MKKELKKRENVYGAFHISESFRPFWNKLEQMSEIDKSPEFIKYCSEVENQDITKRKQGLRSIYIHYVLAKHVLKNHHLLMQGEK